MVLRDSLRHLTAKEEIHINSRTIVLRKAFSIRREGNETFPNVVDQLLLSYRAAIVETSCLCCTDAKYCRRFMDAKNMTDLLSAIVSIIYRPAYNQQFVRSILMEAWTEINERITTKPIRAESPNRSYISNRGEEAKGIID